MQHRLSFDNWQTPWAVLPETLNAIARVMQGDLSASEIQAEIAQRPVREADTSGGVAVIPLRGVITPRPSLMSLLFGGGGGLEEFRSDLRSAVAAKDVGSILLDIDSPGGSTALLTETAAEIRQARRSKPIVAVANTMAASAAYYLGSQATELVVTPSGEVGSIGVFALHMDISKAVEAEGVTPTIISAGKYKTEFHPLSPLSDDAKAAYQETIDEFYGQFLDDVAKGRGTTAAKVRSDFGEGRMVTAKKAVEAGMADRVDTYERTLSRLASGDTPSRQQAEDTEPERLAAVPAEDNPDPNGSVPEEEKARIAALVTARPHHVP